MAARAGAKRVYAIERNPQTAELARQIIGANDARGVVRIVRARSQDVRFDALCSDDSKNCINERATVLISETLATEVNGEFWMGSLYDVRRRGLLTDDAIIVPASATVWAQAVWSPYGMPPGGSLSQFDISALAAHRFDGVARCGAMRRAPLTTAAQHGVDSRRRAVHAALAQLHGTSGIGDVRLPGFDFELI